MDDKIAKRVREKAKKFQTGVQKVFKDYNEKRDALQKEYDQLDA